MVTEYQVGMGVYVYVAGAAQRFLAHALFTIGRLIDPARSLEPEDSGALFNEEFLVIGHPDLRSGTLLQAHRLERGMLRFSASSTPLGTCLMPSDEALAREFARVTASLGC